MAAQYSTGRVSPLSAYEQIPQPSVIFSPLAEYRTGVQVSGGTTPSGPNQHQDNGITRDDPDDSLPDDRRLSLLDKMGLWALMVFSIGPFLILASMGFLAFLWFGDSTNRTWKAIIQRNWAVTSVAICSEVLKQTMSFQLGLMVAMMAALALERSEVLMSEIASFSMMRATSGAGTTVIMLWHYLNSFWYSRRLRVTPVVVLTLLASILFGLTQVISILLVSDIDVTIIPGPSKTTNTSFAFAYRYLNETEAPGQVFYTNEEGNDIPVIPRPILNVMDKGRSGTWYRKPLLYPTFAEYSEPPYEAKGVVDTGRTLRAFLPFQLALDRESLMSYSNLATVLDARVTCQSPELVDPRLLIGGEYSTELILINGRVRAAHKTPRLGNFSSFPEAGIYPVNEADFSPFSCLAPIPWSSRPSEGKETEWGTSICQLALGQPISQYTGGLISEFKDNATWWEKAGSRRFWAQEAFYGNAYLVFNVTTGDTSSWPALLEQRENNTGGYRPPAFSRRNEWYDMVFDEGRHILSLSLCHTAFDFANVPVDILSTSNRTEPVPGFDSGSGKYTFDDIRNLLGQDKSQTLSDRGILALRDKPSWVANGDENNLGIEPWMRSFADLSMSGVEHAKPLEAGNVGNITGVLYGLTDCRLAVAELRTTEPQEARCTAVEQMHSWLFQEVLRTGGSVAFALQSMITVLSSMAYYDQIPQFDNTTMAEQVFFEVTSAPVRRAGFVVVAVAVVAHLFLSYVVITIFLTCTGFSRIGATWSVIAQTATGDTKAYVKEAGPWDDDQVEVMMERDGVRMERAGLIQDAHGEVVVLIRTTRKTAPTGVYDAQVNRRRTGLGNGGTKSVGTNTTPQPSPHHTGHAGVR